MLTRRAFLAGAVIMPFSNQILGGQSTLIRPSIKSPNYVPGVSGWSINKNGTAEFNGITIRGNAVGPNYFLSNGDGTYTNQPGLFIYSGTPAANNMLSSDAAAAGTDKFGNVFFAGKTEYFFNSGNYFALQIIGVNQTWYSSISQAGPWNQKVQVAFILDLLNPRLWTSNDFTAAIGAKFAATDPSSGLSPTEEKFHQISPLNGWAITSAGVAHYRITNEQELEFAGAVNGGAATSANIASIPSQWRPSIQQSWPCGATAGVIAGQAPFLNMTVGGTLFVSGVTPGTTGMTITLGGRIPLNIP